MLAVTQPIRVGDWVFVEDHYGVVEDIRLNYTFLRTLGDQQVVIPNEKLATGILRNDTLGDGVVGLDVAIWLPPTSDAAQAVEALRAETGPVGHGGRDHRRRRAARGGRRTVPPARALGPRGGAPPALPHAPARGWPPPGVGKPVPEGELQSTVARHEPRPADTSPPPSRRRGQEQGLPRLHGAGDRRRDRGASAPSATSSTWPPRRPPLSSLKPRAIAENSRVYAADGTSLGFIQNDELHLPLKRSDIPQVVRDATIAIEDERFYKHNGVDYEGVVRAAVNNLNSDNQQGGSTITMQLVRSLYISNEKTYTRKIREAKLAEELEDEHSKEWILERYLDSIPYGTVGGQSAIGIKAAAKIYFSKELKDLNVREAALLAGIPQATDTYSPVRNPKAAKGRRNEVIGKMAELGMISPEKARKAQSKGLGVNTSQYFTKRREHYFFDYVKDQLFREYGALTVRTGGLKVYTTIDLKKQEEARATIERHLAGVGPSSAIVTIDPRTGYIESMASSGDYGQSNFNLAAQGHRRPGSTFKVMALMTALRMGVDPDRTSYTSRLADRDRRPGLRSHRHQDLQRHGRRHDDPAPRHAAVRQLRLHPARARPRPGRGRQDRAGHGHQVDAQGLPGRDARRPRERRLAAGDGDRLRVDRQRRPARPPDRDHEDQVPGRPRGEGRLAAAALPREAHADLLRRRRREGDGDPRAEPLERHRRPRLRLHDRVPGGRQDRHRGRQHGRVVRRLHAAHVDLRVGRLPGQRARRR